MMIKRLKIFGNNKMTRSSVRGRKECSDSVIHRGADKSLARPGRKQATATEDFYFHISYSYL